MWLKKKVLQVWLILPERGKGRTDLGPAHSVAACLPRSPCEGACSPGEAGHRADVSIALCTPGPSYCWGVLCFWLVLRHRQYGATSLTIVSDHFSGLLLWSWELESPGPRPWSSVLGRWCARAPRGRCEQSSRCASHVAGVGVKLKVVLKWSVLITSDSSGFILLKSGMNFGCTLPLLIHAIQVHFMWTW